MNPKYSEWNLKEAERLLLETVQQSEQSGSYRTLIAALSLLGQLALLQDRADAALGYSGRAMEYLEKMGMAMPALRTEEVLFNHYRVLTAAGRGPEAQKYLEQADAVIRRKASTLRNDEERRWYLERVKINREIITAMNLT
jgi:tetratricopeptide (TPR) repeat protein